MAEMSLLDPSVAAGASRPPFRPIRAQSIFAAACLGLDAFLALVMILAASQRILLLRLVLAHRPISRASLRGSDILFLLGARFHLMAMLLSAVAFLLWIYRARQNLSAFRVESFEFSPAGVVWSFCIPFLNLVQPYSAVREIWQASDPELPPVGEGSSFSYVAAPVSRGGSPSTCPRSSETGGQPVGPWPWANRVPDCNLINLSEPGPPRADPPAGRS